MAVQSSGGHRRRGATGTAGGGRRRAPSAGGGGQRRDLRRAAAASPPRPILRWFEPYRTTGEGPTTTGVLIAGRAIRLFDLDRWTPSDRPTVGPVRWPGDLGARQPGGDRTVPTTIEAVEDDPTVGQAPDGADQASLLEQSEL